MGFDLLCTITFVMILFVLLYTHRTRLTIIQENENGGSGNSSEKFTGDYEDYVLADIHNKNDYVVPDCDFFERVPKKMVSPGNMWRALAGESNDTRFVYDDYSLTPKEMEYTTGVSDFTAHSRRFQNKEHRTLRIFDHDNKNL